MSEDTGAPDTGLDLSALGPWLTDQIGTRPDLTARRIAGGKSNLTYVVSDGDREFVVRRPPLGHVLATAHDMGREHRVMSALAGSAVPVPQMYAECTDDSVLGAPFYVMERCIGTPYRSAAELEPLGDKRTRAISETLVDTLAALHAVDPDAVGLGDFGRAEGYLARQVARWKKQLDASHSRDLPLADELFARLSANVPAESATGIVHGDYRLDNVLVDEGDRITAVLDWEMATLGDPLIDLAIMLIYGRLAGAGMRDVADASTAAGFLDEAAIIERYQASSHRDLSGFGFHLGLAAFKLAAILEGIHFRHLHGQTVGSGFDGVGAGVDPLLRAGLAAMDER